MSRHRSDHARRVPVGFFKQLFEDFAEGVVNQNTVGLAVMHEDGDLGVIVGVGDNGLEIEFVSGNKFPFGVIENIGAKTFAWMPWESLSSSDDSQITSEDVQIRLDLLRQISYLVAIGHSDDTADLFRTHCGDWLSATGYAAMINKLEAIRDTEIQRAQFGRKVIESYSDKSLADLNVLFNTTASEKMISAAEFAEIKQRKLGLRLAGVGMRLDVEQAHACARPEQHLLIKARAGSGKTRTLAAIAALAINDQSLDPDQVMILAFNKKAAAEVGERVRDAGVADYRNARTFHSLAYGLAGATGRKLVFDDGNGSPSRRKQAQFVERTIRNILNPNFKTKLYEFFRREIEQIERIGAELPKASYFVFRRAMTLVTLSGDAVKSDGEKFISDFFFEHGISYEYEAAWSWEHDDLIQGVPYHPDFTIRVDGKSLILEHWAIDPNDPSATVPAWWEDTNTAAYRQQIEDKREWCHKHKIQLIETHTGMLRKGREAFEQELERLLEEAGIRPAKLEDDVLIEKVASAPHTISRMSGLFLQFIQRAKRRGWSVDGATSVIREAPDSDPRNRVFHELALLAYREYQRLLEADSAMDFDDLLLIATDKVKYHGSTLRIPTSRKDSIALKDLYCILLDEYQDFSELYYRMLMAVLEVNSDIRVVAVGDDWQAINGFTGAQPIFFEDFTKLFRNGGTASISTNYRSSSQIVDLGNRLMAGRGQPALSCRQERGKIIAKSVDKVFVEFRNDIQFTTERAIDAPYFIETPHRVPSPQQKPPSASQRRTAKALKACKEFILESWTVGMNAAVLSPSKVLLLSRTGYAYGLQLDNFADCLFSVLGNCDELKSVDLHSYIEITTAHRAKGTEADTVIVLEATKNQFPKVHGDNQLFGPFGVTVLDVLEEERRLFYVIMTRAKRRLLFLTATGSESDYLTELGLNRNSVVHPRQSNAATPSDLAEPVIGEMAGSIKSAIDKLDSWTLYKQNLSPDLVPLLTALERSSLPAPIIGFCIEGDNDDLLAELAWLGRRHKVAVLTGAQIHHEEEWKARGWHVVKPDMQVDLIVRGLHKYLDEPALLEPCAIERDM